MDQHYVSLSFLFAIPRALWLREKAKKKYPNVSMEQTRQEPLMSVFVDLEASVDRQEVLESSDKEIINFIEDAENEDDTSNTLNAPPPQALLCPLLFLGNPRQKNVGWNCPTVGERHGDVSIHDVPPEFWVLTILAGWEDVVMFHISHCAQPEHRIKAAFMMLLLEKQVWLEAEMSTMLKEWLKDIPGVCIHNQQLLLHSVSPQDGIGTPLVTKSYQPIVIGSWSHRARWHREGEVLKQTEEQYLWHGLVYKHDLLVCCFNFSQIKLARNIPDILFTNTANTFPEFLSGVLSVGDKRLEVECEEGLFPLAWAHCQKTFKVGQYMEITEGLVDRWAGWIDAIEDGLVHVDKVEMRKVHPNLLMVTTPPSSQLPAPTKDQESICPTKKISWKGALVTIMRPHHCWCSRTSYIEDVNVLKNSHGRPGLRVLVHLAAYNPNTPFLVAWLDYLNVINEESHLPLNEAWPLADNDDNLYHKYVPVTHILKERAHKELDPAAVLPIHPTAQHYELFLVISGEHCGKWVRGIQFKKRSSQNRSDLEWTIAVVIPRALYLQDDLTDERLVLHSSCMTLANELVQEQKLNDSLKRLLWKPAWEH
ncbi:hypothetical protein EDD18DRAFT_1100630 [Armillaria luteobubalina]|uniref:Uncharacterized protein n=1 Tax=Armillaria luteobubalina TaxID=153913 RepID=A0AA39V1T9_9AGAR|nr:hypothetical protein EDD18DRAFT_1100630 [Armillaria luteobubalina]